MHILPSRFFDFILENNTWSEKLNQNKQIKFSPQIYVTDPQGPEHYNFSHRFYSKNTTE